ncbi:hypothetical protein [Methylotenera sp. G11]|uniref:hypothetical protein n=1 Tax=Methylotenera sp. G11 TaxID=1506585 RepID=UPI000ADF81D4|nr:hypothetical protein [Methylotenera sp. G11]
MFKAMINRWEAWRIEQARRGTQMRMRKPLLFSIVLSVVSFTPNLLLAEPVLNLSEVNDEPNPILIPEINAEILHGEKAGSYWWGGDKKSGHGFELKHSLEIKLQGGTYVIRPIFTNDYERVSQNLAESEVELNDHLTGFNYGYYKSLLVLQGVAQAASSPYIQWMVIRLTPNGKKILASDIKVSSCMDTNIPALWEPGEVENWHYDLGYPQHKTIKIKNLDSDSLYEVKTYYKPGALLNENNQEMQITAYPFEFFEISANGTVRVDNNPILYKSYYEQEKAKGNTWKAFYYGVRAGLVRINEYGKYGVSREQARKFDQNTRRDCGNTHNLNLQQIWNNRGQTTFF